MRLWSAGVRAGKSSTTRFGFMDATLDLQPIETWRTDTRDARIVITTGAVSQVMAPVAESQTRACGILKHAPGTGI